MARSRLLPLVLLAACQSPRARHAPPRPVSPTLPQVLAPRPDGTLQLEAEDFTPLGPGFSRRAWGENLYASTFANTFLSRKAFLSAPAQCARCEARATVRVAAEGSYLPLVRYESAHRFLTSFSLRIEQGGEIVFAHTYGDPAALRVFPFGTRLAKDVTFPWGASEQIVWEGHDLRVPLREGEATLTLTAGLQSGDAAERNIDLVLLTRDADDVARRIEKEGYLPLDGLLTQAGDLRVRLENRGAALRVTIPNGVEHSPYWVHERAWKPKTVVVPEGKTSPWLEVGDLLDTLNDGEWTWDAQADVGEPRYTVTFASTNDTPIATFEARGPRLALVYDANVRTTRRVRRADDVLFELLAAVRAFPVRFAAPAHTEVFALGFEPVDDDPARGAAVTELYRLLGVTALRNDPRDPLERPRAGRRRGYRDVREIPTATLAKGCAGLRSDTEAEQTSVLSVGDEISIVPEASAASLTGAARHAARLAAGDRALNELAERTSLLAPCFPHAGIGANFSPHPSGFLGSATQWITTFRRGALTMPWTEDYAWQIPIASLQLASLPMDLLRAGVREKPGARIHRYVMAHDPGNTPDSFRRAFYAALAHGAKIINLFELRPVQATYTENYTNGIPMYAAVAAALHELGRFDDLVQTSGVPPAKVALWYSRTGEAWNDDAPPFAAGKRALWLALQHTGHPVDVVDEEDALTGRLASYRVLYLTDVHLSSAATRAIVSWVQGGGHLVATAGAASRDEADAPNDEALRLLGLGAIALTTQAATIRFEKEDLPFAPALGAVLVTGAGFPVFGTRQASTVRDGAVQARFDDGAPAWVERHEGRGRTTSLGFLPGLSYLKPALPRAPVDRSPRAGSSAHFLPTAMDERVRDLVAAPLASLVRPVQTSDPLVEAGVLDSPGGLVVVLVNWRGTPVRDLHVDLARDAPPGAPFRASGAPITRASSGRSLVLDLDVADALVWRGESAHRYQ